MIQIWDHFKKRRPPLDILLAISRLWVGVLGWGVNQELPQIALLQVERREKLVFDEGLGAAEVCPPVLTQAPTLNTEEFPVVNDAVGLPSRELEKGLCLWIVDLVGIALQSNIFSCRLRRLQKDIETFNVVKFESYLIYKFSRLSSIQLFFLGEIIEGWADKLHLLCLAHNEVILVESRIHHIAHMSLLMSTFLSHLRKLSLAREQKSDGGLLLGQALELLECSCFH